MEENRPSPFRIIWTDTLAFIAVVFPLVFALIIVINWALGEPLFDLFLWIAAASTVLGSGVLIWRVAAITALYNDAQEVTATITSISFYRDRGRVDYVFTYQNQKYLNKNAVMKNGRTRNILIGEKRTVLVDRDNPKKSILKDLYL